MREFAKESAKKDTSHGAMEKEAAAAWFDIAIAGKRFTIASRLGVDHIREVERLLNETYESIRSRSKGQSILHLALLTALNLADQLLTLRNSETGVREEWERKLDWIVGTLDAALTAETASADTMGGSAGIMAVEAGSTAAGRVEPALPGPAERFRRESQLMRD